MKLKKEDQSVDTSFLLRMGNKIPMEGVTETKFRVDPEGFTIQGLPHLGFYHINNHQTQILLQMPPKLADRSLIEMSPARLLLASGCVWIWWLFMGWIPKWGSLWMVIPSVSPPHFVSVTPSMGILFPLDRKSVV